MKKRKIKINEIPSYYKYVRITGKGYLYYLCDKLSDFEKEKLLNTYNIKFYVANSGYAPELRINCFMVFDKVKGGLL